MSFQRKNGSLFSSYIMYWQYVVLLIGPFLSLMFFQISRIQPFSFSHSTPNLATVIPTMDHIYTHLATASQDLKYFPAIHASLVLGKAHLNKYYNMTDHSEVY